jgi:hypothetical protein
MRMGKGRCRERIMSWTFSLFDLGFACWMGCTRVVGFKLDL